MPNQAYRLRIRSADDLSDALIVTSVRNGTNPYIASVPNGDGQEVDLLTGAIRTGSYVVEVADVVTGSNSIGTLRLVTSQLYDGVEEFLLLENGDKILLENGDPIELELSNADYGRPHLLSRKAFLEVSTDGGATFPTVWQAGFLSSVTQIDAMRYAFTISNTRRVEQTQRVFSWSDVDEQAAFPSRGCILGGPVIGGFGADPDNNPIAVDSGGWRFSYLGGTNSQFSFLDNVRNGYYLSLQYLFGTFPPNYEVKTACTAEEWKAVTDALNPFLQLNPGVPTFSGAFDSSIWFGLKNREKVFAYPNVTAILSYGNDEWRGSVEGLFTPAQQSTYYVAGINNTEGGSRLFVRLYDEYTDAFGNPLTPLPSPSLLTLMRVRLVSRETTPQSPLYFDLHPVNIVTKLYDIANIEYFSDPSAPYTQGSAEWMKEQLGPTLRIAARITEPQIMAEFLEKAIFGPFGFAARTNANGVQEFFLTRRLGGTINYTITDADIQGDAPPAIWSLDEGQVVTGFNIKQRQYTKFVPQEGSKELGPPDNVLETAQPIQVLNRDTTTFSTRMVEYDIPGMVHDSSSFTASIGSLVSSISLEGFDRFGRGAPASEIPVLGTSAAAAAQVGDLVYINAGYYPNKNYRIGESTVGARVAQIVRRDERPEGPVFKLVDAGLADQPALAPAITIAVSPMSPRTTAQYTITNAAALNNADELTLAIEYATGATAPTEAGMMYRRYEPGQIPTAPVLLPSMIPGSKVHVRARTEQAGLFPSLWTAWQTVTLDAWVPPSSVAVSNITERSATVTWSNTSNTTDAINVYVYEGSVAPGDWTFYRVGTALPGSTQWSVVGLEPSTAYVIGLARVDYTTGIRGTIVTASFSTNTSAIPQATRPSGIQVIRMSGNFEGAITSTGVHLALFGSINETYTVIQRAPNTVVGGVDTPGTYADIYQVGALLRRFIDYLPNTGDKYWYRIYHRTPGKTDSTASAGKLATVGPVPIRVQDYIPPVVTPIVSAVTSESGGTATLTITTDDPQSRIEQVRFRERTNNGSWSAWTIDSSSPYTYNATIPATGFVEIEYEVTGFAGDGESRILAAGVEAFDADTNATIVTATGTFSLAGALTLAVQGDTDTNSFKYAVATTDWANDAAAYAAAQAGTLVNARNSTITLSGPYAVGSSVYVAIAGYTGASGGGSVSGPYRYTFANGSQDTIPLTSRARVLSTDNTTVTVRYAVADPFPQGANSVTVTYQNLGTAGVSPASGGTLTPAATLTEAAGTYIDYTITRPAFEAGSGRVTFTATASNRVSDQDAVDVPTVERDTVPLLARARLYSMSATQAVIRVAVACPVAPSPNSATIAYSLTDLTGVTPASGQTVTPELGNTITESAGSYADFTIPRPAPNAVPGRITFTITATGRVGATDAADIVAQDLVAPSLKVVTTPSSSSYSLVVTWDGTIAYDLDGVSQSVSGWTSPRTITVTRNDYLGATQVAGFNVTKNSITVSESVNVPPKDNSGASITIGTQTADDTTDDYEFTWTPSGFPTGTTYNLTYTTITTAGVIEQGSLTNQTSPVTVASGYNIGASPTYQMRVDAVKSGTLILTASRSGTFLT